MEGEGELQTLLIPLFPYLLTVLFWISPFQGYVG